MDLTASSAVNFPMTSASLRLSVMVTGALSIRRTYSAARVPPRFTFTMNFVFVIVLSLLRSFGENGWANDERFTASRGQPFVSYKKDLPHSKQLVFKRDVIMPQDGHILCDP